MNFEMLLKQIAKQLLYFFYNFIIVMHMVFHFIQIKSLCQNQENCVKGFSLYPLIENKFCQSEACVPQWH